MIKKGEPSPAHQGLLQEVLDGSALTLVRLASISVDLHTACSVVPSATNLQESQTQRFSFVL